MTDLPQGLGLYIGGLGLYTEVDGEPLRCDDVLAWAYWMETADRVIGQERIDVGGVEVVVSTVFLGINHAWWPDAPPLVYESMVFTNRVTGTTERYSSRAEALAGHQELVEAVRDAITPQDPARMIDLDALALLAPPHGEGTVHLRTSLFLELLEELGKIRNLLLQTTLDPTDGRALLPDDVRALATILHAMQTGGHSEAIRGIERYYRDSARADRTPRATLYLHFGYVLNHLTKGQR